MEQLEFPVFLTKQVFKNGDGSTGTLYLASNDGTLTAAQVTSIYQKRWKVEEYHKSVKSNASFAYLMTCPDIDSVVMLLQTWTCPSIKSEKYTI